MSLRFRIAESLPRDSVSLRALLQIASIEESLEVPTACVTFGSEPRLIVNTEFVDRHASTPAKLQALIGHELLHVALGHTRRFTRYNAMDNLVFDCLINATWSKAHPTPESTALFRDFYSKEVFPQCFLRPPDDWHPRERVRLPEVLREANFEGMIFVKDVYKRLWGFTGASAWEVREAIRLGIKGLLLDKDLVLQSIPLLGGHDEARSSLGVDSVCVNDFLSRLSEEYSAKLGGMPIEGGKTASEVLISGRISPVKISARSQLRDLFSYLAFGHGTARIGSDGEREFTTLTPIPTKDRRAIVQRQLGGQPLVYQWHVSQRVPGRSDRVHVYVDVSGSMNDVLRPLYGAMLDCQDWVANTVHLFSTKVEDIPLADLRSGKVSSTGGTDIECLAKHIQANKIARALILTDGFVGIPSKASAAVLSKVRLAAGWIGSSVEKRHIGPLAGRQAALVLPRTTQ
jgi:hypothetical protein